jgi:hypothetical protein
MGRYIFNALGRLVDVVGVVTALVFVFEVTTANRSLPSINLNSAEGVSAFEFFQANNRTIVYVSFTLNRDLFLDPSSELFSDPIVVDAIDSLGGAVLLLDWQSLSGSYIAEVDDQRAEDLSIAFQGPTYARIFEAEGVPYVELIAAPFTDSLVERARCSEQLFGQSAVQTFYRYVAGCMLNAASPSPAF